MIIVRWTRQIRGLQCRPWGVFLGVLEIGFSLLLQHLLGASILGVLVGTGSKVLLLHATIDDTLVQCISGLSILVILIFHNSGFGLIV